MKRPCKFFSSALLVFLLLLPLFAAESREAKRVLVLYSEEKDHPAHGITEHGIRAVFLSNKLFDVHLYTENLDVSRFGGSSHAHAFADYLRRKYSGVEIHAIIAVYPYAVSFLTSERRTLFPEAPIIAAEISRGYAEELERSPFRRFVTGTSLVESITGVMDAALRVRPKTKRVALVAGTAPTDAYSEQVFRRGLRLYARKIDVIDLTKLSMEETLSRVGSLGPDTFIFYSSIFRDGAGKTFTPREALLLISRAAAVPVFGLYESYLGFGIVGGRLASFEEHGKEAAVLALRIMKGESPASIPLGGEQAYVSAYDWRELKRWGIDEKSLPPGSIVKYRELSVWDWYKWYITGFAVFCLVETILIISLLTNLRRRRRTEAELSDSELRYRTVATSATDWIYWQNQDGTLRYVSPSAEAFTGYTDGEFAENPALIREIIVPEDRDFWNEHCREEFQESASREIVFRICRKDGRIRWIDHRCKLVRGPDGESWGLRANNRDMTERKQMQRQLEDRLHEIEELKKKLEMENIYLREEVELKQGHEEIVGKSEAMKDVLNKVEQVAPTDSTVLLLGETGTGKDLLAQAIHNLSTRKDRALVTVNCASLPPSLIESELFGREKGAFTGALTRMAGRFEFADRSTLLLDEIGEMPFELQGKLLQILETGQFQRLGSSKTIKCDVRLIASTNRDLSRMVDDGKFRQDLYYRLNVFPIFIPPLRERPEDIPPLVWAFVREFEKIMGKRIETIPKKCMEALLSYSWPGNAREVRNMIEHAMILNRDTTLRIFPSSEEALPENPVTSRLEDVERKHILDVLKKTGWRITGKKGAAEILGMKRSTLQSRMKKLGISRPM